MGEKATVSGPEGEVRRSWILRQAIHYAVGVAYLARVEKAGGDPRAAANLQNEKSVEEGSPGGVE